MRPNIRAFAILICATVISGGLLGLRAQRANGGADAVTGIWLTAEQDAKIEVFEGRLLMNLVIGRSEKWTRVLQEVGK